MPGVLMIESLTQAAAVLLLAARRRPDDARVSLRGVDDAKFRTAGRARRLAPARGRARPAARVACRARTAAAYVGDQVVAEARAAARGRCPARPRSIRRRSCTRRPRSARAPTIGPHAVIGAGRQIGASCRIGASAVIDGWTEIGDEHRDLPVRVDRPGAAGPEVPGRADPAGDRPAATSSASSSPSIAARAGGGGVTTIGDRNVFMAYVHVAHDCHVGNDTIFGNMRDARRPRRRGGLRQHQRRLRRPPVLPRRPPRLHRRLLGGHEGRAAVRADRRQPAGPRSSASTRIGLMRRGFSPEMIAQAEARVPLPAAVEAEHDARRCEQIEQRRGAGRARGAVPGRLHPHARSAASSCGAPTRRAEEVLADE